MKVDACLYEDSRRCSLQKLFEPTCEAQGICLEGSSFVSSVLGDLIARHTERGTVGRICCFSIQIGCVKAKTGNEARLTVFGHCSQSCDGLSISNRNFLQRQNGLQP